MYHIKRHIKRITKGKLRIYRNNAKFEDLERMGREKGKSTVPMFVKWDLE